MKAPKAPDDLTSRGVVNPKSLVDHLDKVNKALTNINFGTFNPTTSPAAGASVIITDRDSNMGGHRIQATSHAAPNTEFTVTHNLGYVPSGFIFMGGSNPGVVYRGATAWTATQIFLKETQGSNTFIIYLE